VQKTNANRVKLDPFAGKSESIRKLAELAERVLNTNSPVLIQGETGVGKGVLARWLHQNGPRATRSIVELNCGGLSRELLETELFGHEKGAFTGAIQNKPGLLEIGHKGTVFLDEIGDMESQVQAKLLKVLEEKTFRRLGDVRERLVDIRLIAATHRSLTSLIAEKKFRDDLYFRISTISLLVPPLRERAEDVPILARTLLDRISHEMSLGDIEISNDTMRYLQAYSWPGNVRELRNVLERAVLLGNQQSLEVADLHFDIRLETPKPTKNGVRTLEEVEQSYIQDVLGLLGGKVGDAAKKLGIPRSSLYSKLRQYRIAHQPETNETSLEGQAMGSQG
jgi:transcriptional regulator with PAS, ATPase and Fis domain